MAKANRLQSLLFYNQTDISYEIYIKIGPRNTRNKILGNRK